MQCKKVSNNNFFSPGIMKIKIEAGRHFSHGNGVYQCFQNKISISRENKVFLACSSKFQHYMCIAPFLVQKTKSVMLIFQLATDQTNLAAFAKKVLKTLKILKITYFCWPLSAFNFCFRIYCLIVVFLDLFHRNLSVVLSRTHVCLDQRCVLADCSCDTGESRFKNEYGAGRAR